MNTPTLHRGLDDIYVAQTAISHIDGEQGSLSYRGFPIADLVQRDFLDVVHLVVVGHIPTPKERVQLSTFLTEHSVLSSSEQNWIDALPTHLHPMAVLQSAAPILASDLEDEMQQGLCVAAKLPSLLAAYYRRQNNLEHVSARQGLSFHENFLFMLHGEIPSLHHVAILDTTQVLQMEHGLNASTFAARVAASTLAPVPQCLSAAIGTLHGRLHGGADEAALRMALHVREPHAAADFVQKKLAQKERIMGIGHRVYRVIDPRAQVLKPLAESLCVDTPCESIFRTLEAIEHSVGERAHQRLRANVEFYKGAVFYALGIPPEYFTAMFAMSRVFGYLAHILESRVDNRLIRPKAFYVHKDSRSTANKSP